MSDFYRATYNEKSNHWFVATISMQIALYHTHQLQHVFCNEAVAAAFCNRKNIEIDEAEQSLKESEQ